MLKYKIPQIVTLTQNIEGQMPSAFAIHHTRCMFNI